MRKTILYLLAVAILIVLVVLIIQAITYNPTDNLFPGAKIKAFAEYAELDESNKKVTIYAPVIVDGTRYDNIILDFPFEVNEAILTEKLGYNILEGSFEIGIYDYEIASGDIKVKVGLMEELNQKIKVKFPHI